MARRRWCGPLFRNGHKSRRQNGTCCKDGLCGYLKSSSDLLEAHRQVLSHHYSRTVRQGRMTWGFGHILALETLRTCRTDWHKKQESIKAVLNRRI